MEPKVRESYYYPALFDLLNRARRFDEALAEFRARILDPVPILGAGSAKSTYQVRLYRVLE